MTRRHALRTGDWPSVFERLLELVTASSGDDPFEEIYKLLVARLWAEQQDGVFGDEGLGGLLGEAAEHWPDLVDDPQLRLPEPTRRACVQVLAPLAIQGAELEGLDAAFEALVGRAVRGEKGQFFTPRHVIEACVRAACPRTGERVLDPACGSGGFLLHALRYAQRNGAGTVALHGVDIDRRACRVASLLLRAAGAERARIDCRDSLRDLVSEPEADLVLANPPFAGEIQDEALIAASTVARPRRRVERDALFLERCTRALRPGGRLALVLPSNKIGGDRWGYLRRWLLQELRVVSVLSLGRRTFLPYTHQKACVLFALRRAQPLEAPRADEAVLLAVSEAEGKDGRGRAMLRPGAPPWGPSWERLDHDLGTFVDRFHTFTEQHGVPWSG